MALRVAVFAAVTVVAGVGGAGESEIAVNMNDCAALNVILRAAKSDFRTLEGSAEHEQLGMWQATVAFAGGRDCLVYAPPFRMYTCRLYVGDDESDADTAYRDAVAKVRKCVPKGWRVRERINGVDALTKASHARGDPSISVTSTISDAAAYLVDFSVDLPMR
jgi:hypothetical protein